MRSGGERGNTTLRFLDRYAGIPIVVLLGLLRRKQPSVNRPTPLKAAFLHTAAIGDTVLLSAVVKDFKNAFPAATLTLFTGASNYQTAGLIAGIDRIVKLPVGNPLASARAIREAGAFDLWLDFGPWPRINALLSFCARAGLRVGFKTPGQCRHQLYDLAVPHSAQVHELENYRRLLQAVNVPGRNFPALDLPARAQVRKRITIHMYPGGYRAYLKEWPEGKWVALISALLDQGCQVFLTGAAGDRQKAQALAGKVSPGAEIKVVAGELDIKETAELLQSSRLVISVNTGIMHLAAALGCRLVALHGPTSQLRWGPLNTNALSVQSPLCCSPCLNLGFDYGCRQGACMAAISVEEVLGKVEQLLEITEPYREAENH